MSERIVLETRGLTRVFGERVPVRALAVLYVQPLHFVTFAEKGIASLADLRGKVVSTGSPGSGTVCPSRGASEPR